MFDKTSLSSGRWKRCRGGREGIGRQHEENRWNNAWYGSRLQRCKRLLGWEEEGYCLVYIMEGEGEGIYAKI